MQNFLHGTPILRAENEIIYYSTFGCPQGYNVVYNTLKYKKRPVPGVIFSIIQINSQTGIDFNVNMPVFEKFIDLKGYCHFSALSLTAALYLTNNYILISSNPFPKKNSWYIKKRN